MKVFLSVLLSHSISTIFFYINSTCIVHTLSNIISYPLFVLQADILNYHHNCDVVIFMYHKHGSGRTVSCYGTNGAGQEFISQDGSSESGKLAIDCFWKFVGGTVCPYLICSIHL